MIQVENDKSMNKARWIQNKNNNNGNLCANNKVNLVQTTLL